MLAWIWILRINSCGVRVDRGGWWPVHCIGFVAVFGAQRAWLSRFRGLVCGAEGVCVVMSVKVVYSLKSTA